MSNKIIKYKLKIYNIFNSFYVSYREPTKHENKKSYVFVRVRMRSLSCTCVAKSNAKTNEQILIKSYMVFFYSVNGYNICNRIVVEFMELYLKKIKNSILWKTASNIFVFILILLLFKPNNLPQFLILKYRLSVAPKLIINNLVMISKNSSPFNLLVTFNVNCFTFC